MGAAQYRFLPWARRGLSAAIAAPDTGTALAARAQVQAGLTVSNAGSHGVNLAMYGPGDIIGLDPRQIIRADPAPNTTNSEPNYLAAIEFDNPELPWLFTPAAANGQQRLRPWLVLIVLETSGPDAVAPPRTERDRPLPFVTLTAPQVGRQLPDLAQSWAWAHSQLLVEQGDAASNETLLGGEPARNLSRLVCPTRMKAMTSYIACLVPAFDLGVIRGIGGAPDPAAVLQPAWNPASPADITLPVYFHWEFTTGPDGDFESLARELKPRKPSPGTGTVPMYIWDALPGLHAATPQAMRDALVLMDGALRAPEGVPARLSDIPPAFRDEIRAEINAPADIAQSNTDGARAIAAPIYGGMHAGKAKVPENGAGWLRELNLDPRARIAAGLGAEVVRAHQEVFMQACWEQVGKVLEANELLNQGRLAAEALARVHTRIKSLPAARQLAIAQPLQSRVPLDSLTVEAVVARSSLPDASLSPQYRRLAGARRPAVRAAARANKVNATVALVERMAPGQASVDPNDYTPDGITGLRALADLGAVSDPAAMVDLTRIGIDAKVPGAQVLQLQAAQQLAQSATATAALSLRSNLATIGMVTDVHLLAADTLIEVAHVKEPMGVTVGTALGNLIATAEAAPRARAFVMEINGGMASAGALDVLSDGQVIMRSPRNQPDRVVAMLGNSVARDGNLAETLADLPVGTLKSTSAGIGDNTVPVTINRDRSGRVAAFDVVPGGRVSRRRVAKPRKPEGFTLPVAELDRSGPLLERFGDSFTRMVDSLQINAIQPQPRLVVFDLVRAAAVTATRLNPRTTVPARLATMVQVGGVDLTKSLRPGIIVPATVDRIMAAPELPEPAYARLAAFDREAFLPGADTIPPNTITLLETNPRFIEAYMIGLNHEMNRELLWRRYPTDQRGTPFEHFWDWEDGKPDLMSKIHAFAPAAPLGHNTRGGADGGNLVLLVRGSLLRRYPNCTIMAWRATSTDGRPRLMDNPGPNDLALPAFFGSFAPDISFAGFDLTLGDISQNDDWFFVIQQQVTEPRFGFDEGPSGAVAANPANWRDARWIDTGTAPGQHLDMAGRLAGVSVGRVSYARDAAHLAALALQRPFRLAVHARHLTKF